MGTACAPTGQVAPAAQVAQVAPAGQVKDVRCDIPDSVSGGHFDPAATTPVAIPRKREWEAAFGGESAARPHVPRASPAGRGSASPASCRIGRRAFLRRVARDTWRGLAAFTDREHALPVDHVRLDALSLARPAPASATTRTSRRSASTWRRSPRRTRSGSSPATTALARAARRPRHARPPRDASPASSSTTTTRRRSSARATSSRSSTRAGSTAGLMVVAPGVPRARAARQRADRRAMTIAFFYDRGARPHAPRLLGAHAHAVALPLRRLLRRVAPRELRRDRQGRRARVALVLDGAHVSRRLPRGSDSAAGRGARRRSAGITSSAAGTRGRTCATCRRGAGACSRRSCRRSCSTSVARAGEPRRERRRARHRAAALRARDARLPVWGFSPSAAPDPARLRRARRARPRHRSATRPAW